MLTQEYLKSVLDYNPETGELLWRPRPIDSFKTPSRGKTWNTKYSGKRAGNIHTNHLGFRKRTIRLAGKTLLEHRAIWTWMTGQQPPSEIDHIDRDATNNKWSNLRNGEGLNDLNRSMPANNTTGFTGIYWIEKRKKWHAEIKCKGNRIFIGHFDDREGAEQAVVEERRLHGNFTDGHGQPAPYR